MRGKVHFVGVGAGGDEGRFGLLWRFHVFPCSDFLAALWRVSVEAAAGVGLWGGVELRRGEVTVTLEREGELEAHLGTVC